MEIHVNLEKRVRGPEKGFTMLRGYCPECEEMVEFNYTDIKDEFKRKSEDYFECKRCHFTQGYSSIMNRRYKSENSA